MDTAQFLTFDSFFEFPYSDDPNIIHDDYTGHKVTLEKAIGIREWHIDNRSISSPDGDLILENYNVLLNGFCNNTDRSNECISSIFAGYNRIASRTIPRSSKIA